MNTEKMTGKTIVITGSGSGMGAAMAKEFASREAKVALLDLNEEGLKKTAKAIEDNGGQCVYYKTDVTDKKAVEAAADAVEEKFGPITSWVNSAGVSRMQPFLDCSEELWDLTIDVNLKATFLCCQVAITKMLEHGGGTILNMSSLSGKKPSSWQTIYCASKFGIRGLTQSVAVEFASEKIRCNAICPSVVQTPMWDAQLSDYAKKRHIADSDVMPRFIHNTPLGRLCEYDDIWNLVEFLSSDLSSYMTGQSLNLTGGACMD